MTGLKETIGEVAALRLALSVTRYWTEEIRVELEKWVDYAEENGDHHSGARKMLETWAKQSAILEGMAPPDSGPKVPPRLPGDDQ